MTDEKNELIIATPFIEMTKEQADDKLLEEIAEWFYKKWCNDVEGYIGGQRMWNSLEEERKGIHRNRARRILSKVQEQYVRLADDQSFPTNIHHPNPLLELDHEITMALRDGWNDAQKTMWNAGFRKIEGGGE